MPRPSPLLATFFLVAGAPVGLSQEIAVDRDNVTIDRSCTVVVGPDPIRDADGNGVLHVIAGDVRIEFDGELSGAADGTDPDRLAGVGIVIRAPGVTLSGARVSGFKVGIRASDADGLVLEDCDVSDNFRQRLASTPDREDASDWLRPHDNDEGEWAERYGAGVLVERSERVTLRRCRARRVQNGLVLDRVSESLVYDNDFSFLSGWGLALWRSSRNFITRNAFDFCIRGYSHGVYNRGQDSAGILLFEQCSGNVIAENSATHGGDGLFAFAGREALGEGVEVKGDGAAEFLRRGNNDNIIARNDFSYAAAHGLELTFSFGNQIFENRFVENAICGIWGGYSRDTLIARNLFARNGEMPYGLERGGINIEHGQRNVVLDNRFENNACGVHLWWDADEGLAALPWTAANGFGSGDNLVIGNEFEGDAVAIQLRAAGPTTLASNRMRGVGSEVEADESSPISRLQEAERSWEAPEFPLFGDTRPVGARTELGGRAGILVTEWGPYDRSSPLLWRERSTGAAHRYRVLGAERERISATGDVSVLRTGDGFDVVGEVDASVIPYEVTVETEGSPLHSSGALVTANWKVTFFTWSTDPRDDADAWRIESEAGLMRQLGALDFAFGSGGPSNLDAWAVAPSETPLPTDRFGTVAHTVLSFPPGRWSVRTLSDDGIRLWADGELLIDDWTHHATRAHEVVLDVDEPSAVELRVEHFELDGAATLVVEIGAVDE